MNRRNFLRLGALFVPAAIVEPRRVYSFIWARPDNQFDRFAALYGVIERGILENDEALRARIARSIEDNRRRLQREVQEAWGLSLGAIVIKGTVSI